MLPQIFYTIGTITPTLAAIEDINPPAYEPVALGEEAPVAVGAPTPGSPITSSLRSTRRLLLSIDGWRSFLRGFGCKFVATSLTIMCAGFFMSLPFVPYFAGTLLASLLLVQLHTAWVHIVISVPNPKPFWHRLQPMRKVFSATWAPVLVSWAATAAAMEVPRLLSKLAGLTGREGKEPTGKDAVWGLLISLLWVVLNFFVAFPAHVVLVRVQASLLAPEEDTIVPFDRSFGGKVEPTLVGGKGYVSMRDAFVTFPTASWRRVYVLMAKIFAVVMASYVLVAFVIIPEVVLIALLGGK